MGTQEAFRSIGQVFRETRTQLGLTLKEVSAATRISEGYLKKLEENEFTFLPDPFVRGFIANTARFLRLSAEPLLRQYDALTSLRVPDEVWNTEPEDQPRSKLAKSKYPLDGWAGLELRARRKEVIGGALIVLLSGLLFLVYRTSDQKKASTQAAPAREIPVSQYRTVEGTGEGDDALLGTFHFGISAEKPTWMMITLDDSLRFEVVMAAGQRRDWHASSLGEVKISNAAGATLFYEGEMSEQLPEDITSVHLIVDKGGIIKRKIVRKVDAATPANLVAYN